MRTVIPVVQPRDRLVGSARNEGSKAFGLDETACVGG
jgi:hypothetical protein